MGSEPAAAISPGDLETQFLGLDLRSTKSETLGVGLSIPVNEEPGA